VHKKCAGKVKIKKNITKPRLGALEVVVNGCIIFSKIKSRRWPIVGEIRKRLN